MLRVIILLICLSAQFILVPALRCNFAKSLRLMRIDHHNRDQFSLHGKQYEEGEGEGGGDRTSNSKGTSYLKKLVSQTAFSVAEAYSILWQNQKSVPSLPSRTNQSISALEMRDLIRTEYENIFWITGQMNMDLWEPTCIFSDPFSSFGGDGSTLRFKRNADALGSLVVDAKIRITSCDIIKRSLSLSPGGGGGTPIDCDVIKIGWTFSSKLKLPWRPVLSATGDTYHYLSPTTGKIIKYEETWKSKPLDVVLRLFQPTSK